MYLGDKSGDKSGAFPRCWWPVRWSSGSRVILNSCLHT